MGVTLHALEAFARIPIAGTGTITLPVGPTGSIHAFSSGDDYEVLTVEGNGGVDVGTKTAADFDYTLVSASAVVIVVPRTPITKAHID